MDRNLVNQATDLGLKVGTDRHNHNYIYEPSAGMLLHYILAGLVVLFTVVTALLVFVGHDTEVAVVPFVALFALGLHSFFGAAHLTYTGDDGKLHHRHGPRATRLYKEMTN